MMSTATTDPRAAEAPPQPPLLFHTPASLRRWSERCRAAGMEVGLVPTMGALHAGHISLVRQALEECDRVIVSVFVNPRQFGEGEDIDRYPRPLDADLELLTRTGAHAVFVPSVADMYPCGAATSVRINDPVATTLEGAIRPGHFEGVALVVAKLFGAARPTRAYFGRKDAQQCAVVRRLAADLDTGVAIVVCPVVRDSDGLALSSRNAYLTPEERRRAVAIPRGLSAAAEAHLDGERRAGSLCELVREPMESAGFAVDYVVAVDPETFNPVDAVGLGCQILVAGRMGQTRLIDVLCLGFDAAPVPADPQGASIPGEVGVQGRD